MDPTTLFADWLAPPIDGILNFWKAWHIPPLVGATHDTKPISRSALEDPARPLPQAYSHTSNTMPGPKNTLLIEGSFEELTDEFAQYIDTLKKSQGDESSNVQQESADLLKENKKDEVLKKLVVGAQALNQAPEKGMKETQS